MKRFLQKFLALMMVLWTSSQLSAQDFTVDGINYQILSETDKTVEVIGGDEYASQDIVIPEEISYNQSNYQVIGIGRNAFLSWRFLISIQLPKTIQYIGASAFKESGLNSIEIPAGVTELNESLFSKCKQLSEITLSPNTSVIGDFVFSSCSSLSKVNNIENVKSIGRSAFSGCSALKEINLPNATQIGSYAFQESGLRSFSIPDGVADIKEYTFEGCRLQRIIIPSTVKSIGERAFQYCPTTEVVVESLTPPSLDAYALYRIYYNEGVILYVPEGAVDAYKNDPEWGKFEDIMSYSSKFIPVESITLSESSLELYVGESKKLIATVLPDNATNKTVTWSSNAEEYVTADQDGNVKAISTPYSSEPKIYAEVAGGKTATCKIKVLDPITIELNEGWVEGYINGTVQLIATVKSINETEPGPVTWRSSNEEVATVSQDGLVTFVGKGGATIYAEYEGYSAFCLISVAEKEEIPAQEIELNESNKTLKKGETLELHATVYPEDATDEVTWTSSNEEVATVDQNGVVTAVNKGEATITVTAGTVSATCKVTVVIPATDIELDKKEATIEKGETLTLEVTVVPEDTTDKLVWTSEDENVATVDEKGVVTAVAVGTTKITVTAGKVSASCDVTVVISAKEIALDKDEATIEKGETLTLTPTVVPEDTTDKLVWTSEDENIATVNENGVVTAVAVGTTKITVTAGKVSTFCDVTVVISAKDITLDKTEANIEKGKTLELKATVNPEDTTDKLIWISEDENVATVDENGVVTAVAPGTATITVTAGKVSASCDVTVVISMTGIELDKTEAEGYIGGTVQLTATVKPEDTTDDTTVTWTSSDEEVATVDENGLVSCLAEGEAVITATCGEFSAECTVTVTDRPPFVAITSLELSESEIELALNFTYSLFAIIAPENATDTELEWSSSDINVARVYEGVVYGIVPGEAVITAKTTDGSNLSASCKVTIVETSGIDGIESDGVKVTAAAGVVTVKGAAAGSTVEVYSMSGACVAAKTVESSVEEFPIAASGIYVVRAGGKTFKVAL